MLIGAGFQLLKQESENRSEKLQTPIEFHHENRKGGKHEGRWVILKTWSFFVLSKLAAFVKSQKNAVIRHSGESRNPGTSGNSGPRLSPG